MKGSYYILTILAFFSTPALKAQIEVAHLQSKDFSASGFGAFLNFAFPVNEGDYLTLEGAAYFFEKNDDGIVIAPLNVGYRRTLDGTGAGFWVEPTLGYTLGASDISKYDSEGHLLYDESGSPVERKVTGPTAGIGAGYTLRGQLPFSLGARYQFVKVIKDPVMHVFSLRLSYAITFGRRE